MELEDRTGALVDASGCDGPDWDATENLEFHAGERDASAERAAAAKVKSLTGIGLGLCLFFTTALQIARAPVELRQLSLHQVQDEHFQVHGLVAVPGMWGWAPDQHWTLQAKDAAVATAQIQLDPRNPAVFDADVLVLDKQALARLAHANAEVTVTGSAAFKVPFGYVHRPISKRLVLAFPDQGKLRGQASPRAVMVQSYRLFSADGGLAVIAEAKLPTGVQLETQGLRFALLQDNATIGTLELNSTADDLWVLHGVLAPELGLARALVAAHLAGEPLWLHARAEGDSWLAEALGTTKVLLPSPAQPLCGALRVEELEAVVTDGQLELRATVAADLALPQGFAVDMLDLSVEIVAPGRKRELFEHHDGFVAAQLDGGSLRVALPPVKLQALDNLAQSSLLVSARRARLRWGLEHLEVNLSARVGTVEAPLTSLGRNLSWPELEVTRLDFVGGKTFLVDLVASASDLNVVLGAPLHVDAGFATASVEGPFPTPRAVGELKDIAAAQQVLEQHLQGLDVVLPLQAKVPSLARWTVPGSVRVRGLASRLVEEVTVRTDVTRSPMVLLCEFRVSNPWSGPLAIALTTGAELEFGPLKAVLKLLDPRAPQIRVPSGASAWMPTLDFQVLNACTESCHEFVEQLRSLQTAELTTGLVLAFEDTLGPGIAVQYRQHVAHHLK